MEDIVIATQVCPREKNIVINLLGLTKVGAKSPMLNLKYGAGNNDFF